MDIKHAMQLYFIMGSQNTTRDPVAVVSEAIEGGITCFQYREKGSGAKTGVERVQLGKQLRAICSEANIPFIVNDDIELAIQLNADGIHVGQSDTPLHDVRKSVPAHFVIGVSTSTIDEAVQAKEDGANYIGVGPIYQTISKADASTPIGEAGLRAIQKAVPTLPIVAISGLNETNAPRVIDSGATGISLISAISQATDIVATTKKLRAIVEK